MSTRPAVVSRFCAFTPVSSGGNCSVKETVYTCCHKPAGFINALECNINGHTFLMDQEDGYILWTSISKALGCTKRQMSRMLKTREGVRLRKVNGGCPKLQGIWIPYEDALVLSRKYAYNIRTHLVPLFGPSFPDSCLPTDPDQPPDAVPVQSAGYRKRRLGLDIPSPVYHPPEYQKTYYTINSGHSSETDRGSSPRSYDSTPYRGRLSESYLTNNPLSEIKADRGHSNDRVLPPFSRLLHMDDIRMQDASTVLQRLTEDPPVTTVHRSISPEHRYSNTASNRLFRHNLDRPYRT